MATTQELLQEYLEAGFSLEEAKQMAGMVDDGQGGGLPFDVIKINYDKDDILSEHSNPVKKGQVITGWEIDKKNLTVKKEGKVFNQPLEFVIFGVFYQYSAYDTNAGTYKHITEIFKSLKDAKKVKDFKTGKTREQLQAEGEKLKFNQILGVLVKEEGKWQPYLIYLRGVNYSKFWEQLKERGIDNPTKAHLKYIIKVKTKRVSTPNGAVWVYEIVETQPIKPADLAQFREVLIPAINKLDEWVNTQNGQEIKPVSKEKTPVDNDNVDINEEEDTDVDWED